ncbi:MAG TPA: hypothetical protein VFS05_11385 [Gemmatimonadaceae bacterium]|nr:hypothetical protein [Gemmatimonadaceae bacterium]
MPSTRREFLDRLAVGAALGALPVALGAATWPRDHEPAPHAAGDWDVSWSGRLRGKHKVVFDVPEVESGYGVWRASIWEKQYQQVLGTPARDLSAAVVLRHNGIVLAMQQPYWDEYGVGKEWKVTHPVTAEPTDRNPALLSSARGEVPAELDAVALDRFLARGGIALACDLALQEYVVAPIQKKHGVSAEEARKRALALMVPGVIVQPSGIFAVVLAQDAGCSYVRAS